MSLDITAYKALSIMQPWAWLIVNGHKVCENRTWFTKHRGPLLIHAGQKVDRRLFIKDDGGHLHKHQWCVDFWQSINAEYPSDIPHPADIVKGGIVGIVDVVDCVTSHDDPYFFGPYGFVMVNPRPTPFIRCRGQLGIFTPKPMEEKRGTLL